MKPRQIIDTHTHFFDPTRPEGVPWPKKDSSLYRRTLPADYLKLAEPLGVRGTVVVEASPWVGDNDWLLALAAKSPAIVGVVGNLPPGSEGFAAHLERLCENRLFRGIRIRGNDLTQMQDNPKIANDLKQLAAADRTLDILRPKRLSDVARLAQAIPGLRIVVNHFPGDIAEATSPRDDAALRAVAQQANVFAKVSSVLRRKDGRAITDVDVYRDDLNAIWNAFGQGRVIYGSNWPVCERVAPYADVQQVVSQYVASRGQQAADQYFWRNAQQAYKWVDRSSE